MIDPVISRYQAKFPPLGRCVYCGATEGPLTSEHLFPFALGTNAELLAASCVSCARTTSQIELYVARTVFQSYRTLRGIQSRRRQKQTMSLVAERHGVRETLDLPTREFPGVTMLPEFPVAGILRGDARSNAHVRASRQWTRYEAEFPAKIDALRARGYSNFEFKVGGRDDLFARFLAKVALVSAVANIGYDERLSPLRDVILDESEGTAFLVGGDCRVALPDPADKPDPREGYCEVSFEKFADGHISLLVAHVTVYGDQAAPTYSVVVGPAPDWPPTVRVPATSTATPPRADA